MTNPSHLPVSTLRERAQGARRLLMNKTARDQGRAAVQLVTLARAGHVSAEALLELGTAVVGVDLDSTSWLLKGWNRPRRVRPGTGLAAMLVAVGSAFEPQRVRLGRKWIKDTDGNVAEIVPATDLAPAQLARFLRCRCLAELKEEAVRQQPSTRRPLHLADERDAAVALFSEYSLRGAIHPYTPPRAPPALRGPAYDPCDPEPTPTHEDRLSSLTAPGVLTERERDVLLMHLTGKTETQIAAALDRSGKTVRRALASVREKARAMPRAEVVNAAPPGEQEVVAQIIPLRASGFPPPALERLAA